MESSQTKISVEYSMEELLAQNKSLAEELSQCKADKEFVWTLWKRLQSSQPDMTSVVSMVVAREKEKAEMKDQKVLEILQRKDEKIKELEELNMKIETDGKDNSERVHSLLMENLDLKERFEELQKAATKREKDLLDENLYLNEVVKARQGQFETLETKFTEELEKFEQHKSALREEVLKMDAEVQGLRQTKEIAVSASERNEQLEEKIKSLEKELSEQREKSEGLSQENEDFTAKLRTKESQLEQHTKIVERHIDEMEQKTHAILQLRKELKELQATHNKSNQHITEQGVVIEQLQGLQKQTQQVLNKQEESYKQEVSSLQKVVSGLKKQSDDLHQSYQKMLDKEQQKVEELENVCQNQSKLLIEKDELIQELRVKQTDEESQITTSTPVYKTSESHEVARRLREMEEENESLREVLQERLRRISSLEKLLKSTTDNDRKKKQQKYQDNQETDATESEQEAAVSEDLEAAQQILTDTRTKLVDLQELIDLKDNEVTEMRKAHDRRLLRLKTVQESHQLVIQQLATYENEEEKKEEPEIERPSPRELKQADKDGVWNELTYFRREYEKLHKERLDWEEEVDVLRVQHASDLAIIQELRLAVQSEREGSEGEMRRQAVLKDRTLAEAEKQITKWQQKVVELEMELESVEREREVLEDEMRALSDRINQSSSKGKKTDIGTSPLRRQSELNKSIHKLGHLLASSETEEEDVLEKRKTTPLKQGSPSRDIEKQLKPIADYEEHVRRIGENLDRQSSKRTTSTSPRRPSPHRVSPLKRNATGTQTDPETSDFGAYVDMDEAMSDTEESLSEGEVRKGKTPRKRSRARQEGGTPFKVKKTGVYSQKKPTTHREWLSMKHRIHSLSQQVTVLRSSRNSALKSVAELREANERMQGELNLANQRLKVGRQSTQKLTEELEEVIKEKQNIETLEKNAEKNELQSQLEWKKMEDRLKLSSNECSRLSFLVKSLRTENEELKDKLNEVQEKIPRLERDVAQKKNLIEEMRTKLKTAQEKADKNTETTKELESKLKRVTDRDSQKKVHMESLKRHIETETKEKKKYQQMYYELQEDLRKKDHLIAESQSVRTHAEMAVSEMEAAAQQQLQSLANQSETTIKLLNHKLGKLKGRNEEFHIFVKTLADELLQQLHKSREAAKRHKVEQSQRSASSLGNKAMKHAQNIACSILDMSSSDLEDFMEDEISGVSSNGTVISGEKETILKIDRILQKQTSFAVPLLQVLLGLIEDRVDALISDS